MDDVLPHCTSVKSRHPQNFATRFFQLNTINNALDFYYMVKDQHLYQCICMYWVTPLKEGLIRATLFIAYF